MFSVTNYDVITLTSELANIRNVVVVMSSAIDSLSEDPRLLNDVSVLIT